MEGARKCILSTFKNKRGGNIFGITEDYMALIRHPCVVNILDVDPVYGVKYDVSTWEFQDGSRFAYFEHQVSAVEHYRTPAPRIGNTHMVYPAKTMVVSWRPSDEGKGIFILKACDHLRHTFADKSDHRLTINCCDDALEKITSTMLRPVLVKLRFKDRTREKELIMEFVPGYARSKWDPPPGKGEFKAKQNACWYCKVDESALEPFTFEGFLQNNGGRLHPTSIGILWMKEKEENRSKQILNKLATDPSPLESIPCSDGRKVDCHSFILEESSDMLKRLVSSAKTPNSSLTTDDQGCIAKFNAHSSLAEIFVNYVYTENDNSLKNLTLQEISELMRLAQEYQVGKLLGHGMNMIMEKEDIAWFEVEDLIQLYSSVRLLSLNCELAVNFNKKMLAIMRKVLLQSKNKRMRPNESGDKEETVLMSMMKEEDCQRQQILRDVVADLSTLYGSEE